MVITCSVPINVNLHLTLHHSTLHRTTLNFTTLHYTTLHSPTLQFRVLHNSMLHYRILHCSVLQTTHLSTRHNWDPNERLQSTRLPDYRHLGETVLAYNKHLGQLYSQQTLEKTNCVVLHKLFHELVVYFICFFVSLIFLVLNNYISS